MHQHGGDYYYVGCLGQTCVSLPQSLNNKQTNNWSSVISAHLAEGGEAKAEVHLGPVALGQLGADSHLLADVTLGVPGEGGVHGGGLAAGAVRPGAFQGPHRHAQLDGAVVHLKAVGVGCYTTLRFREHYGSAAAFVTLQLPSDSRNSSPPPLSLSFMPIRI